MVDPYEYYKGLCGSCPPSTGGAGGDGSSLYDYYKNYCVCDGGLAYLGMRDLDGNEVHWYPVTVYNVNQVQIGYATTKVQYINVWNADPDNEAVGILMNGGGSFGFVLKLNPGQISPPWVIGVPDDPIDNGIYEKVYEEEYE